MYKNILKSRGVYEYEKGMAASDLLHLILLNQEECLCKDEGKRQLMISLETDNKYPIVTH